MKPITSHPIIKLISPMCLVDDNSDNSDSDPATISSYGFQEPIHSRMTVSKLNFNMPKLLGFFLKCFLFFITIKNALFLSSASFDSLFFTVDYQSFIDIVKTQNLPFCETPYAITPYMAQGASALAHLPYIPTFLLGLSYSSPETILALNTKNNKSASNNVRLLWIQFALQLFTSFGHIIPNPRIILSHEISIMITFLFLFSFLEITTPSKSKYIFKTKMLVLFTSIFMFGYIVIGLIPVIFLGFVTTVLSSFVVNDSFGLITNKGRTILLYTFIPTALVLLIETTSCNWLLNNISTTMPWHLVFDILFWQMIGSTIDVIIICPKPGIYLKTDTE